MNARRCAGARANLDGSGAQHIITGAGGPQGITVDGTYVYWANHSGTVGRANLDGSGINQLLRHRRSRSGGGRLIRQAAGDERRRRDRREGWYLARRGGGVVAARTSPTPPGSDPTHVTQSYRVLRGSSWFDQPKLFLTSSDRSRARQQERSPTIGFRCAKSLR